MRLPDDIAQRALDALARPLRSHELADAVWPERVDRPLAAKSRAGHAAGRDLIERGWAIQNPDGTYFAAAPPDEAFTTPAVPPELHVGADGAVVEVQRRTLGHVAAAAERLVDGELVVDPATGTVTRVVRQVLGHAQIPAPPRHPTPPQQADSSLIVENGVVMRVTKQVLGPLPPQAPPPQQVPAPQPPPRRADGFEAFIASKYPEMIAVHWALSNLAATTDPSERHRKCEVVRVHLVNLGLAFNPWCRAYGLAELPVAALTPVRPMAGWSPMPSYTPSW